MYKSLENLGLKLSKNKKETLIGFEKYFKEYNSKINLISSNDSEVLFEKHIYDSLALNLFIQKYNITGKIKIADIGAGGGFPSIPIAAVFDNFEIFPVDSVSKKINFIKSVAEKFSMNNLHPVCSRVEDLPKKYFENFDIVVSRAVGELGLISEYSMPFVKTGGFFVAYKSLKAEEELKNAQNALKILNAEFTEKTEYSLPLKENFSRCLLIFKKTAPTDKIYPRKNGIPQKKPL